MDENTTKEADSPKQEQIEDTDPYSYLNRDDFTSEKYKIEIKNLPKYYGISELRKLLNNKLKLNSCKIKTPKRNCPYAFVCFRSEEERTNALEALKAFAWKGNVLNVSLAKPSPDPLVMKRKNDSEIDTVEKKMKMENCDLEELLKNSTIPLWNVPYDEQLKMKHEDIKNLLIKLTNMLKSSNPDLKEWLSIESSKYERKPCPLKEIRHSSVIDGYRNKCEFTVGIDPKTKLPTVGFRIGSYVQGVTGVGSIDSLAHIPNRMKIIVKLFQDFVRSSKLTPFDPEIQTGNFKQLTIRYTSLDQVMVIVGIHPQNLSENEIADFKKQLIEFFTGKEFEGNPINSLYLQFLRKKLPGETSLPMQQLYGSTHIYESILGLKFRISPEAFFQVNSSATEILYSSALELAKPVDNSTVLDICCGTGTIGLCFAKACKQVLGLEIVPEAIVDAKENAKANGIDNSEFFVGKAEEILSSVCYRATGDSIIAIADPPRAGLHPKAIMLLRKIKKISKLIYVSCNPSAALKNFVDLSKPESKTMHGDPFVPVEAVAVDMFPYTKHCELVVCFKRFDSLKDSSADGKDD